MSSGAVNEVREQKSTTRQLFFHPNIIRFFAIDLAGHDLELVSYKFGEGYRRLLAHLILEQLRAEIVAAEERDDSE